MQLSNGKTIRAKKVISNATRWDTFGKPSKTAKRSLIVISLIQNGFFLYFPQLLEYADLLETLLGLLSLS